MPEAKESRIASLRKKIEEKSKNVLAPSFDKELAEKITERVKRKEELSGKKVSREEHGDLRDWVEGVKPGFKGPSMEHLLQSKDFFLKFIAKVYESFKGLFDLLINFIKAFPLFSSPLRFLESDLDSAFMHFTVIQYLGVTVVSSFIFSLMIFFLLVLAGVFLVNVALANTVTMSLIVSIVLFFLMILVLLIVPSSVAKKRADALDVELPFALRHIATELRAGIGLNKTLQTIAVSDYGALSEEFARTLNEIEEGTEEKTALKKLGNRTKSNALREALNHVVRAMKTGGNLSDTMEDVAEEVSHNLILKMREFSEKMNFFGVIFIFVAIVLPVFVAVLGAIRNAPLGLQGTSIFTGLPLGVTNLIIFYVIIMPLVLAYLTYFLFASQPRV